MDDCNHYYLSFYFVMYSNIRYWGYVSRLVTNTLRTIKGATDVRSNCLIGGCLYCFRAIYLNKCIRKQWDPDWHVWYFIRPLTSTIAGAISYLFLKAGLLVLESSSNVGASEMGFFALAFIAGFNVDKFVAKIEEVAKAVWGIEKTRSSTNNDAKNSEKKE